MAQEKDITSRPKFFTRKKSCDEDALCEVCRHHQHVLLVRVGCDALMFTDTRTRTLQHFLKAIDRGTHLHFWCIDADDPPSCLEQFKEVRALR